MGNRFSIGPSVRQRLGPLEGPVADLYRSIFFNVSALARAIQEWTPASAILEVGCGEGALTEQLACVYPEARITGIDVTPRVGRLFRGDRTRVAFLQQTVEEFSSSNAGRFDLVVMCDVMHHISEEMHEGILRGCRKAMNPGGGFVLKDWDRLANPIHLLSYLSDRFITGDRIAYRTASDFRRLIELIFGSGSVVREFRSPPWRNNVAFFARDGFLPIDRPANIDTDNHHH